jgi:type I restriction-modification system DNA methylase subunit
MPLFQNSVVSKYLKNQNATLLLQKWEAYKNHFLNLKVQEDIKSLKEEQYQGEFLEDLFVKILGYTKPASSTETKFNLTTEYKNVKDSKKADGAIIIEDKVKAVIELKGTNTTDLGKIEAQAFGYKNNQPDCVYVITSNFEKIRFYIDNAIEFLEFNLFQLTQTEFELLYLCLAYDNLSKGIAKTIKDESVSQEDVITKKLYKDYSLFKRELHQNLVALNPQYEPIELFKKSQKLLDRFLFIFFAEDRNLLPTNLIFRINKEWQNLRTMRIEVSLYERYKIYFSDLNSGAKVVLPAFSQTTSNVTEEHQIFAYNGGLFKADDILDNIKIDDAVLFKHTENLSNYDFASEVDVNILGHIFENSLNELDEIKAQLEGETIDKAKTKRKKDGVFYTPKYITKYIVENTIGKLCEEKKTELQLVDEDYTTDKKRQKKTLQALIDKVETYRSWLLQLTICDPACGSGAFLNQALDFLIAEHQYIDELKAKLFGDTFVLSDVENSILENNLFGVDLNEESVEIAKLSLWLRTAQPNRKLNDLSSNIQCGNSLIDDIAVAGDKAFNWQQSFEKVFAKGGFDVIIGNPPYAYRNSNTEEIKTYFNNNYESVEGNFELYKFFIEKGLKIINSNGVFSFITSSSFLIQSSFQKLRKLILDNSHINELIPLGPGVFDDATVDTAILILSKNIDEQFVTIKNPTILNELQNCPIKKVKIDRYRKNSGYVFDCQLSEEMFSILDKAYQKGKKLKELYEIGVGINTGYIRDLLVSESKINEKYHLMVPGSGISRYGKCISTEYIMYDKDFVKSQGKLGRTLPEQRFFDLDKILVVRTRNLSMKRRIVATIDLESKYNLNRLSNIISKNNNSLFGLLGFLNSNFFNWLFTTKYLDYEIKPIYLKECPIIEKGLPILEDKSKHIYSLNQTLQQQQAKVINLLQRDYGLSKPSKKLETWYELSLQSFFAELTKAKIVLSAIQKDEVQEYFETYQKQAVATKDQIIATDKQIDAMVYELYGLSNEEIEIVENS